MSENQTIQQIPIDLLDPHPHNPRGPVEPATVQELADSIKEKGILEPLLVVPQRSNGQKWKVERFLVVAGHRRRVAAELAGLDTVPAIVRDFSAVEQEEVMLVENLQREDLSLLQEAKAYRRLIEHGEEITHVARKLGLATGHIHARLVILRLSEKAQDLFDRNDLPLTAAPLLAKVTDVDRQERLAHLVASRRLTVPKLQEMIEDVVEAIQIDKQVDRSRSKPKPEKREETPAEAIYSKADAIADLKARNGDHLAFTDLVGAMDGICTKCGLGSHPAICAACPLPQLVRALIHGEKNAQAASAI